MKKFLDLFRNKEKEVKKEYDEDVVFNVDNFNKWFNDPNNKAVYANPGIFLRLDKLSESHIKDYLEKSHGIFDSDDFKWSVKINILIYKLYNEVRKDWRNKINN
jgi:hypothetical protein